MSMNLKTLTECTSAQAVYTNTQHLPTEAALFFDIAKELGKSEEEDDGGVSEAESEIPSAQKPKSKKTETVTIEDV